MKTLGKILFIISFVIAATTANAQKSNFVSHTVVKGQTLYSISKMYNTTVDEIIKFNPGSAEKLSIGQKLIIPRDSAPEEKNVKKHTIKAGETLYRLSKMYNVTTDEICAANPGLSINNFRAGEVIIIPTKKQELPKEPKATIKATAPEPKTVAKKEQEKPQIIIGTHKVARKESIESICEKYNITSEELIKANPILKEKKLKRKMVLNIPAPSANKDAIVKVDDRNDNGQQNKKEADDEFQTGFKDDEVLNVAVVLSFLLDSYAPKEQSRMVEYYEGLLMAVEQLKREGYSFIINTYDAGHKENSLDSLLTSNAFDDVELIIGASYTKHNKELAKFAKERNIPLVIPFSSKKDEAINNPMVYVANGVQQYILPQVSERFVKTFPNANVVFVEDTVQSNKKEFVKSLKTRLDKDNMPYSTVPMELISNRDTVLSVFTGLQQEEKEMIIIPTSSAASTLNTLLPSLLEARNIDTTGVAACKLFGYPEWQIHANETRELMYEVDTYFYATFYSHVTLPRVMEFQDEYKRWYNRNIQNVYPRYGMLGYDTGYYFLLAASLYGNQMHEKINEVPFSPVQSDFKFERISGKDGFTNNKFFFIHFCPEYWIDKMDFDKKEYQEGYQDENLKEILNPTTDTANN